MADSGSSKNRISGSEASARASATRWRSPPRALGHGFVVVVLRQLEHPHQRKAALAPGGAALAPHLQRELDVLADRLVIEEGEGLKDHAGRAPVGGHLIDPLVAQEDVACGRLLQAAQHAQQRGLAAARRPHDGEELALLNVEGHVVDRNKAAELLGQVDHAQDGRVIHHGARLILPMQGRRRPAGGRPGTRSKRGRAGACRPPPPQSAGLTPFRDAPPCRCRRAGCTPALRRTRRSARCGSRTRPTGTNRAPPP